MHPQSNFYSPVKGVFVTGTGTDIGKTLVTAWLLTQAEDLLNQYESNLRDHFNADLDLLRTYEDLLGLPKALGYWKPIQSGLPKDRQAVQSLMLPDSRVQFFSERYDFSVPASPHYAAALAGTTIEIQALVQAQKKIEEENSALRLYFIEGAGGVMVPIKIGSNQIEQPPLLMLDLVQALHLPALVVCSGSLGTLNHTLLTVEALKQRNIWVEGIILSSPAAFDNESALESLVDIPILGCLPQFDNPSREALSNALPTQKGEAWLKKKLGLVALSHSENQGTNL